MISYDTAFMLHTKILHLMPHPFKLFPCLKKISFRASIGI